MAKIVIFGNQQIASVGYFYLTHDSSHEVVAFTVDREYIKEDTLFDLPVVPFEEVKALYPPDEFKMSVMISYRRVNKLRAEKYYQAKDKGYELISYVSSRATTWPELMIGDNCFIFEDNVIQPFVEIGNNVIMWSGNHIGHHTVIKDHCFLASHIVVSGSVTIEPYCFLGVNATLRDNITIARECVIGAGALILQDTQERGVHIGQKAKLIPKPSNELRNI
jgi:sugar O-acyltransferase (sialic acid O-acetyltransferase NeuD family)